MELVIPYPLLQTIRRLRAKQTNVVTTDVHIRPETLTQDEFNSITDAVRTNTPVYNLWTLGRHGGIAFTFTEISTPIGGNRFAHTPTLIVNTAQ